jgi:hypothetical protein
MAQAVVAKRNDLALVRLPFVRSHAGDIRGSTHDHGSPIGAADGRNYGAGAESPETVRHQAVHHRRRRFLYTSGAETIDAEDDDVASRLGSRHERAG